MFNSKVVVRAGWGMYYDRGELYSYLSPGLTQNITNGGPFGINQQATLREHTILSDGISGSFQSVRSNAGSKHNQLAYPWGYPPGTQPTGNPTTVVPPVPAPLCPASPSAQNIGAYLQCGLPPFYLGAYASN